MKNQKTNAIYKTLIILLVVGLLFQYPLQVFAEEASENPPKEIKVGYFSFDGYHDMDDQGNKSGYGYEVLQLLKRYENWKYEYVGFDKSWSEMLDMLENGEIDLLTSASKSDGRLEKFDYSDLNIGENSIVLAVREDETRYLPGHHPQNNGMKIGFLRGSTRNDSFRKHAQECNFTYEAVYYDKDEDLEYALKTTKEIDAIVTSSIRSTEHEKILEEFNPTEFFVIVKKGNTKLLAEVNDALTHLNNDEPGWRERLKARYYAPSYFSNLYLTDQEYKLTQALRAEKKVFTVLVSPDNAPYSFKDDGKLQGIIPDIFDRISKEVGISYQYLPISTMDDYEQALKNKEADIILDSTSSLQAIETMGMDQVGSRLESTLSLLSKRRSNKKIEKIAVIKDFEQNAYDYFGNDIELIECQSIAESIKLLEKNRCDGTLLPSKRAELVLAADYKNQYNLELLSSQALHYSLVAKSTEYTYLPALLARSFATITAEEMDQVTSSYVNQAYQNTSIIQFLYAHPLFFLVIIASVSFDLLIMLLYTLKKKQEITNRNEGLEKDNAFLKHRDALTGGYNRSGFLDQIEQLRSQKVDLTEYAILFTNIKRFKAINDMHGVENADELLRHIYTTVQNSSLQPILCARIEADHFSFLVKKENLDLNILEQLLQLQMEFNGKIFKPQCICGIYEIEAASTSGVTMLNYANIAVHCIADDNASLYIFYEKDMRKMYIDQDEVLTSYENALANNEFKVFYQPIIHTSTGEIASAEALIRWQKANGVMIRPDVFIPVLEKNACITKIDNFVENTVCHFLSERQRNGKKWVPVSVNLSQMDFHDKEFVNQLSEKASIIQDLKNGIRYEITETAYATLEGVQKTILEKLNQNGIDIVLDDFGSGYSSFGMIQEYKFSILKIDMSFTRQLLSSDKTRVIVQSIISMCHKLGLRVVTEGVESAEEVELLKEMGCDYIQGYYFSKPLCEEDFIAYLEKSNAHV